MYIRIPLSIIFLFQSLLVIGAFVAVILVLTEQQRTEFRTSVEQRLSLQQSHAMQLLYSPMQARLDKYKTAMHRFKLQMAADPRLLPTASASLAAMQPFYDEVFSLAVTDPLTQYVMVLVRTDISISSSNTETAWAVYGVGANGHAFYAMNASLSVCISLTVPVNTSRCGLISVFPYDQDARVGADNLHNYAGLRTTWSTPSIQFDPVASRFVPIIALRVPLGWSTVHNVPSPMGLISISLTYVKQIVENTTIAASSVAALFRYDNSGFARTGPCTLLAARADFSEVNITTVNPSLPTAWPWRCGHTPSAKLNAAWTHADGACTASNTACAAPVVTTITAESDEVVLSFIRLRTAEDLDVLLLQYTPREYFFAASERSRRDGILIGAFAALAVALTCLGILLAIRRPITVLQANMDLAAVMKNDEVRTAQPVLSEVAALTRSFDRMNTKLLLARPFLPPSLLLASGSISDDEDDLAAGSDVDGQKASLSSLNRSDDGTPSADEGEGDVKSRRSDSASQRTSGSSCDASSSIPPNTGSVRIHRRHQQNHNHRASLARLRDDSSSVKGGAKLTTSEAVQRFSVLSTRRVAVLVVNIRGFHAALKHVSPERLAELHRVFAQQVEACAGMEKGIVDSFHGDRFVVAFNTVRSCALAALAGARTSEALRAVPTTVPALQPLLSGLGLSMGLSGGRALVGNMGTSTMQRLVTISDAFSEAVKLQDLLNSAVLGRGPALASALAGRCLFTGRLAAELEQGCVVHVVGRTGVKRLVGSGALADPTNASEHRDAALRTSKLFLESVARAELKTQDSGVVLLGTIARLVKSAAAADEWMYELAANEASQASSCLPRTNAAIALALLHASAPIPSSLSVSGEETLLDPQLVAQWRAAAAAASQDQDHIWFLFLLSLLEAVPATCTGENAWSAPRLADGLTYD